MTEPQLFPEPFIHETATVIDSTLGAWSEVGPHVRLTETVLGDYSYVVDYSEVIYTEIGKFSNIASYVRINPGNHPVWRASLHHFTYRSGKYNLGDEETDFFDWRRSHPVSIGHDTWIGHGAVILPGVSIGTGAVVGAGSVVTKDVPPYTIAAGVPAKPIRERFPVEYQEALMKIAWWDWPHEKLKETLADFRNLDIREFIEKYLVLVSEKPA